MKKKLVFAGGGHSHIRSLTGLDKFINAGADVTVISKAAFHYYSGMGPGLLSGFYEIEETRFHVKKITESFGCRFIEGSVKKIIPTEKKIILSDNSEVKYDVVSFNTGSDVIHLPLSGDNGNLYPVKPVENIIALRDRLISSKNKTAVAVIGGGAAGFEIAANLRELADKYQIDADINLISGNRILANYQEKIYTRALEYLHAGKIKIFENKTVSLIDKGKIIFTDGNFIDFDIAVNTGGITPSKIFTDSGMKTGKDGGLVVNEYLQSSDYPDIFGGGDCISFEKRTLNRVGVYAVKEGMVLYRNLLSYLKSEPLEVFKPQKKYLSIMNAGFRTGLMEWKGLMFSGRMPFYLKYYLDKSFMKKYQKI